MSFFTASPEDTILDLATERMEQNPAYADRYEAIAELRAADQQGLSISVEQAARANGFFRVASLQGSLQDLAMVLNPEFLKQPKNFYRWLDRHKKHVTYDRRKNAVSKQLTMVDGKVAL